MDGDSYGLSINDMKKPVTIKAGKTSNVSIPNKEFARYIFDDKGKLYEDRGFGIHMVYEGNDLHLWFNDDNKLRFN